LPALRGSYCCQRGNPKAQRLREPKVSGKATRSRRSRNINRAPRHDRREIQSLGRKFTKPEGARQRPCAAVGREAGADRIVERRSLPRSPKTLSRFEIGGISGFPNIYPGRNASVRLLRRSSDYAINRQLATNTEKRYGQVVVSYEAKLGNCAKLS
jgi:hypothetical protein